MGLENSEIVAISALILSFFTFIFTLYRTRKKGPKIDLYRAKLRNDYFIHENKTFTIDVSVYAENYGDKASDLILEPTMIVFDDQDKEICSSIDYVLYDMRVFIREPVPISNPILIDTSGYLPAEAEEWKKVEVNFNAYYFRKKFLRKKWTKVFVTNNKFILEK